jgi:hypothetical protein
MGIDLVEIHAAMTYIYNVQPRDFVEQREWAKQAMRMNMWAW